MKKDLYIAYRTPPYRISFIIHLDGLTDKELNENLFLSGLDEDDTLAILFTLYCRGLVPWEIF